MVLELNNPPVVVDLSYFVSKYYDVLGLSSALIMSSLKILIDSGLHNNGRLHPTDYPKGLDVKSLKIELFKYLDSTLRPRFDLKTDRRYLWTELMSGLHQQILIIDTRSQTGQSTLRYLGHYEPDERYEPNHYPRYQP